MAVSLAVGLSAIIACRSEAATPAPAAGIVNGAPGSSTLGAPAPEFPVTVGRAPAISYAPDTFSPGVSFAAADGAITGIQVSGIGRATGVPDLAVLTLGVEASRDTVEAARADAASALDKMVSVLKGKGVAERDIQTRYFSIYPRYDQTGRDITGYQVSNILMVKVRNLSTVGSVIDDVTKAGGNITRFQGISFTIENTKALEERARAEAAADLQARAKQLAALTGVQLGRPTTIIEGSASTPPMPFMERAMVASADATTPVLAGEMEVVVTLQAIFAIQ